MNGLQRNDELLRSYLLGGLAEDEADRLERRLIEEDGLFDLCEAVEADLLAAYDRGELSAGEQERVRRRLASHPAGWERLALARSLNTAARRPAVPVVPRRRPAPLQRFTRRWAAAAAVVLMATGALWLARQNGSSRPADEIPKSTQPDNNAADQSGSGAETRPTDVKTTPPPPSGPYRPSQQDEPKPPPPPPEPAPAQIMILMRDVRDGADEQIEELRVPAGTKLVEIQLVNLGGGLGEPLHAVVRSKEKGTVWEEGGLKLEQKEELTLVLKIPAESLPSGRYEVLLTDRDDTLTGEFDLIRDAQ